MMQAYTVNGMRLTAHPKKTVSKLSNESIDRLMQAVERPHKQRITINMPPKRAEQH